MAKKENHMGFMSKLLSFGSDKDLKRYYKIVDQINGLEPQFEKMTEEELRGQTDKFRERYANGESLDDMLPEAFATCREAADRVLGLRPYRVQLVGGIVLHQGRIAEMKTGEGKTFQTKAEVDPVLDREYIDRMTKAYAPDRDLTDPYISPLYGDFRGFPPVYIQVGENEILLDDSLRLYKNLIKAGVSAHMDRFPGMWHVFQMSPFKRANEAMDKSAEFIYSVCR